MQKTFPRIYLAPKCCADEETGRMYCQDNVWPCDDCPDRSKAVVEVYEYAGATKPELAEIEDQEATDA